MIQGKRIYEHPSRCRPERLLGQQGSSLIQVMIAFGLTAVLAGTLMSLHSYSEKSRRTSELSTDVNTSFANVRQALTDDIGCSTMLQNANVDYSSVTALTSGPDSGKFPVTINSLRIGASSPITIAQVGNFEGVGVTVDSITLLRAATPIQSPIQLKPETFGLPAGPPLNFAKYNAELKIVYYKFRQGSDANLPANRSIAGLGQNYYGSPQREFRLTLQVYQRLDNNRTVGCFTEQNYPSLACASMDPSAAYSETGNPKCQLSALGVGTMGPPPAGTSFGVTGNTNLAGNLNVTGSASFGSLAVSALTVSGALNAGSITSSSTVTASSDARLKTDIRPVENSLRKLLDLNGVSYLWKDSRRGTGRQVGLIAQEVEQQFPELVVTGADGYKSVNYMGLVAPLVEALKTQQAQNAELEKRIQSLERTVRELANPKANRR